MKPLLALFVQTMRQLTRTPATYGLRAFIAASMLGGLFLAQELREAGGAAGLVFFTWLVSANFVAVTLLCLGPFASAITEEKETGTLGLLRMADLDPVSILFGKASSRLAAAFLLLFAQLPFAFLAVTMGGVSHEQVLIGFALVATYLFALSNVSLCFSVLVPTTTRAGVMVILALVGFGLLNVAPVALSEWLQNEGHAVRGDAVVKQLEAMTMWLASVNPVHHAYLLSQSIYFTIELQRTVLVHAGIGVLSFLLAWLGFERFCGTEARYTVTGPRRRWRWLWRPSRPRSLAITWKQLHFSFGGRRGLMLKTILSFSAVFVLAWIDDNLNRGTLAANAVGVGMFLLWLDVALMAMLAWGPEVRANTLGSLVTLPCRLWRVHTEKLLAMLIALLPVLALFIFAVCLGGRPLWDQVINPLNFYLRSELVDFGLLGAWDLPFPLRWVLVNHRMFLPLLLLAAVAVRLSLKAGWFALPMAIGAVVVVEALVDFGFGHLRWPVPFPLRQLGSLSLHVLLIASFLWSTHRALPKLAAEH